MCICMYVHGVYTYIRIYSRTALYVKVIYYCCCNIMYEGDGYHQRGGIAVPEDAVQRKEAVCEDS